MRSKVKDHKLTNGVFVTPLNSFCTILEEFDSWSIGKVPEYLWIGLILEYFGRDEAFNRLNAVLETIKLTAPSIKFPKISSMFELPESDQNILFGKIRLFVDPEVLAPLSALFTYKDYPFFCKHFFAEGLSLEDRIIKLQTIINKALSKEAILSTDIQYVVIKYYGMTQKLTFMEGCGRPIFEYLKLIPDSTSYKISACGIRSLMVALSKVDDTNAQFINWFWDKANRLTECNSFIVKFPLEDEDMSKTISMFHDFFSYYIELYKSIAPRDTKMEVILGLSVFAYKRFKELIDHNLSNTIAGRSCSRGIAESLLMLKYLLLIEKEKANVWKDYQIYGFGRYKFILEKYREAEPKNRYSQFSPEYLEVIINEFLDEEVLDMDTNYFETISIRAKAKAVDEIDLYGQLYEYDSMFEHGMWGAVRESVFIRCDNPLHLFHSVPDLDNDIPLKGVIEDSEKLMLCILRILINLYGSSEKLSEDWGNVDA